MLPTGYLDTSITALARDFAARDILTVDQRHFRAVRALLRPSDAAYWLPSLAA